jgi:hypothetical protein
MNTKTCLLSMALGIALSGAASALSIDSGEAADLIARSGFTEVSRPKPVGNSWVAMARSRDGDLVEVSLNPVDSTVSWVPPGGQRTTVTTTTTTTTRGPARVATSDRPVVVEEVIEVPVVRSPVIVEKRILVAAGGRISKDDVRVVLSAAGYHDIHDIDWLKRRGVWKAEARDRTGNDLEIHVDPLDGRILHVEDD